ncbi:hypothetical protein [Rhodococcus sp. NPDC003383]
MTNIELHRHNPELMDFTTRVAEVHSSGIIELEATAFYARSGGQHGDTGLIGDVPVLDTVYDSHMTRVLHHCDPDQAKTIRSGELVEAHVSADRRRRTMRLHTLQHLAYIAAVESFGPRRSTGGDITDQRARVDVERFPTDGPIVESEIVDVLEGLVRRDLPIHRYQDPSDPDRWWWKIDGFDAIPCGGTHLTHTGQVGDFALLVKRKGAAHARITCT